MEQLGLPVPDGIAAALADPANETPKPDDPAFAALALPDHRDPRSARWQPRARRAAPRATRSSICRIASRVRRARWRGSMPRLALRGQGRRTQGRDHQRRRARGDGAQQGRTGRSQPGICAGSGTCAGGDAGHCGYGGGYGRHRRRRWQGDGPGGALAAARYAGSRLASAISMPRTFSTTMMPRHSSRRSATLS